MKKVLLGMVAFCALFLVACNQLTQYTISEQEINQALVKHDQYNKTIGLPGVADAHIVLSNLKTQIGREEPGKVKLTGDADIKLTSIFGNQQALMKLTLKATPSFDAEQGAIYLKDLEVTDTDVEPQKMQTVLQTLNPYLNDSLRAWFEKHPAYVLKDDRSNGEKLAKKYAKGIEVKPGEIVIPLL
ncbi:lipoprotein [Mangrovibacter yixingensis]|uniref:lipoprotein n=1 Tax=Mangrovibacter yixingensis TaxID=1529639 RepID=UPI001CFC328D|nr:lipoprotein [Mangrovibacter yixingensis]